MYRGKNQKEELDMKGKEHGQGHKLDSSTKFMSIVIQLALMAVAALIVYKTCKSNGIILYTFHPTLMAVGYLILIAQGILSMSNRNMCTENSTHEKRVSLHVVTQFAAVLLITVAQVSIYVNKNNNDYAHYQSIHSICGLVTYLMTLGATVGGICNNNSSKFKKFIKPIQLKVGHGMLGSIVYVFALSTICLGINQVWSDEDDGPIKLPSMTIILISAIYIVFGSIRTALARIASMSK